MRKRSISPRIENQWSASVKNKSYIGGRIVPKKQHGSSNSVNVVQTDDFGNEGDIRCISLVAAQKREFLTLIILIT